jgi:hypothetical protein
MRLSGTLGTLGTFPTRTYYEFSLSRARGWVGNVPNVPDVPTRRDAPRCSCSASEISRNGRRARFIAPNRLALLRSKVSETSRPGISAENAPETYGF